MSAGREHAPDLGDDRDVRRQVLGDLAEDHEVERGVGIGKGPRQVDVGVDGIARGLRRAAPASASL